MKRLLMVSYHYPPDGKGSGVLRSLKFSKYLLQYGWLPHVLTLSQSFYEQKDEGLLDDIPAQVPVHRTPGLDSARHLAIGGRHLGLLTVPDRFLTWLPFAVPRGLSVIRDFGIRALYSTSPPPTTHLIAAALQRLSGLPWVADFRDPWIEEGFHPRPGTLRHRVESALERMVLTRAEKVVVTTPQLGAEIGARYPQLREKFVTVYNGYDEEDFEGLDQEDVDRTRFEIIHAGLVTGEFRDPAPLLRELGRLLEEGTLPRDLVRVTFLGGGEYVESDEFRRRCRELSLEGIVHVAPRVPHREALRRQARAAVLLLLQASDDTRALIPAKAFEYLRLSRPILALTLDGASSELLRSMDSCHVVDPADGRRLGEVVGTLFREWRDSPEAAAGSRPAELYSRRRLTGELAAVLDELDLSRRAP